MPSRRSVPLPTREQLDRVRESLIRSAERQHRINDIMTQLAGAVGPSIADLGARGSSYLAGETSLLSGDFGFFASPPMLWWKGILWAHDPAWIYRHPRQRIATRWSILPAAVAAPSEVVRSALRAAVHLMLLDGIVLHLVPESQVNPAERNKLEAGLAFKGPLVDAPELHAQRPRVRVTNSKVETDDRIQFFRSLDERDGSMVLCYTAGLLSTKLPHWTSHLKRLLWLLQRGICPDCQNTISWDEIHVDHLRTRNNGGTSTIINLMLRHPSCNIHKGAKETGWELSPRVFDRFGSPIASQSMLLQQLFDPGLTADRLHQICRSYSRRARL